jgi:hypothetical protein
VKERNAVCKPGWRGKRSKSRTQGHLKQGIIGNSQEMCFEFEMETASSINGRQFCFVECTIFLHFSSKPAAFEFTDGIRFFKAELKQEAHPCAKMIQPLEDGLGFLSVAFNFFLGKSPTLAKNTIQIAIRLQQHAHFHCLVNLQVILLEIVLDGGSTCEGTKCGVQTRMAWKKIKK